MMKAQLVVTKLLVDDKITACVKQINTVCLLGVICKVSNRKTFFGETFSFLEKCLLSIFKFCALSKLFFFYERLIGPRPTFSEFNVIFL